MPSQERQAIVTLLTTLLLAAIFFVSVLPRYPAGNPYSPAVFHFWGVAVVILIPVSIVANMTISIVFSIVYSIATQEKAASFADERDKFIEARAFRNTVYVFTCGFFLAMGSLVLDLPPSVMFIVIMGSGFAAVMVGNLSQLYLYRKGS
ncbi:MAG TPA: hypothetical protein VF026_24395 [Ktedonobacteraceae bacterium]